MKMIGISIILVIGFFLFAGCSSSDNGDTAGMKNCGKLDFGYNMDSEEMKCFTEMWENCEPAKLEIEDTRYDGHQWIKVYMEIQEGTPESCTLYYKITDVPTPSPPSSIEKEVRDILNGKDMICKNTTVDDIGLIIDERFAPMSDAKEKCAGSLITAEEEYEAVF